MLLIGLFNVAIGMCAYESPRTPDRIIPQLPPAGTPAGAPLDTIGLAAIPTPVMRAFAIAYPRHIPSARRIAQPDGSTVYELTFTDAGKSLRVSYRPDGSFLSAR